MQLSIVIICWNDLRYIGNCIESIYRETNSIDYEIIVTDNNSTDNSIIYIEDKYPEVILVKNKKNLGFAGANNEGFKIASGRYVLILNPDTIITNNAIEKLYKYAEKQKNLGALGCRVLNPDRSYQASAYPIPTIRNYLIAALYLRFLGKISIKCEGEFYLNWRGDTERIIGFQAGCCLLVSNEILKHIGGFDKNIFFQFEDADLCRRISMLGKKILFYPKAEIIHIGGQSRGTYSVPVVIETQRSAYKYFFKHEGFSGIKKLRYILILRNLLRYIGYSLIGIIVNKKKIKEKINLHREVLKWHKSINPMDFVSDGSEPDSMYRPLYKNLI